MDSSLVSPLFAFLDSIDIINFLQTSKKYIKYGFEDEKLAQRLLHELAVKNQLQISLENCPSLLIKALSGTYLGRGKVSPFEFMNQGQTYTVQIHNHKFLPIIKKTDNHSGTEPNTIFRSFIPFTTLSKDQAGQYHLYLSVVKYFEVTLRNTANNSIFPPLEKNQECAFSFGISTLHSTDYFVYKQSGRICSNGGMLAHNSYYRFHAGDVLGCGIFYCPTIHTHAELFFTKNGEMVFSKELSSQSVCCEPWFPFTV
jgi:hypothetical protein